MRPLENDAFRDTSRKKTYTPPRESGTPPHISIERSLSYPVPGGPGRSTRARWRRLTRAETTADGPVPSCHCEKIKKDVIDTSQLTVWAYWTDE